MTEDRDALVEADAIIKRELDWVLNVEPPVAHMSSNRKIDRKDALSAIERIRRDEAFDDAYDRLCERVCDPHRKRVTVRAQDLRIVLTALVRRK